MTSTGHDQNFHAWTHEQVTRAYRLARLLAVRETNLAESTFPATCPYDPGQVTDPDFYPD